MQNETKIECPGCGTEIDVNNILAQKLENDIKKKYHNQLLEEQKKNKEQQLLEKQQFEQQCKELSEQKEKFERLRQKENELFQEKLSAKLKEERRILENNLKSKLAEEQAEQFNEMQRELNQKSEQIKELNRTKSEIEKLKREKNELKEAIEAEAQRSFNQKLVEEKDKIRKAEQDKMELSMRELQKQLEDQKRLTAEMKRKQEQGSMQLQGEVQELAIEEWLMSNFPLDSIEEIRKGARGGDCIQIVNSRARQNCGTIYYESKRAKDFQPSWIEKFKNDIRDKGANIGVLVTEVMPAGMERMGLVEGVWVCNYEEFKGLCHVLRESVIQISLVTASQENKGEKMSMLYDFLTSNTFKMQIEAIVEGFTQMKSDLDSEKRSMQRIWKTREKQIDKVTVNTIDMYASIKGIAGNAIGTIQALELSEAEPVNEKLEF